MGWGPAISREQDLQWACNIQTGQRRAATKGANAKRDAHRRMSPPWTGLTAHGCRGHSTRAVRRPRRPAPPSTHLHAHAVVAEPARSRVEAVRERGGRCEGERRGVAAGLDGEGDGGEEVVHLGEVRGEGVAGAGEVLALR